MLPSVRMSTYTRSNKTRGTVLGGLQNLFSNNEVYTWEPYLILANIIGYTSTWNHQSCCDVVSSADAWSRCPNYSTALSQVPQKEPAKLLGRDILLRVQHS